MLKDTHNPKYAAMSDNDVLEAYSVMDALRNPDTMSDTELDLIDAALFSLDSELCARGLDLPC